MKLHSYLLSFYAFMASIFRHHSKAKSSGDVKNVMPGMGSHSSRGQYKNPKDLVRRRIRLGRDKFYYFIPSII